MTTHDTIERIGNQLAVMNADGEICEAVAADRRVGEDLLVRLRRRLEAHLNGEPPCRNCCTSHRGPDSVWPKCPRSRVF
jgi:hypothetical protein